MNIGTTMTAAAIVTLFAMPLVFAYMWVKIRTEIMDNIKEKQEEKKALLLLINVEMFGLLIFVVGSYLNEMVNLAFTFFCILVILIATLAFNKAMNAPQVETITEGGSTA